jgi:hypothetical protein
MRFQKLTRSLFLNLHGHNVHRQQRQLSKFLMRYQQFASHAYCGAVVPVSKMASQQEKAFRVWDEFDYRVDVYRVTQGAHIE